MFAMNPPPTVGLKTLIIFGLSFVKQLAHGLIKRFAGYVTLLNAFVLVEMWITFKAIRSAIAFGFQSLTWRYLAVVGIPDK